MITSRERNGNRPSAFIPEKLKVESRGDNPPASHGSKFDVGRIEESISTFVRDHTGTSLIIALTIGGIAGWFLKRKI
jgi:hypothetical protein